MYIGMHFIGQIYKNASHWGFVPILRCVLHFAIMLRRIYVINSVNVVYQIGKVTLPKNSSSSETAVMVKKRLLW